MNSKVAKKLRKLAKSRNVNYSVLKKTYKNISPATRKWLMEDPVLGK